jgi:arsenate reductase-like glutaredoxin family protein
MGCKKAQGFLESRAVDIADRVDASKERKGRDAALKLAKAAAEVVVARGKKIVRFDMKKDPPHDDVLAAHLLGPTGNLRAPTLRKGKTLLVGFSNEAYQQVLKE